MAQPRHFHSWEYASCVSPTVSNMVVRQRGHRLTVLLLSTHEGDSATLCAGSQPSDGVEGSRSGSLQWGHQTTTHGDRCLMHGAETSQSRGGYVAISEI